MKLSKAFIDSKPAIVIKIVQISCVSAQAISVDTIPNNIAIISAINGPK